MLIQPDSSLLGDKNVKDAESVAKLKEENDALTPKMEGQDELNDAERSGGPQMPYTEVIRRLRKANREILFRDGSEGNIAVFIPRRRGDEDYGDWDSAAPDWYNDHHYVTGFPKGPIPEFSHITTDERGRPHREVRGWRTVLMALIKAGGLTYQQAVKHFGEAEGRRSWRWHKELRKFKGAA